MVAPAGKVAVSADAIIHDSGQPDVAFERAGQVPVERLPDDALVFLLPSRFCEGDELLDVSWELFGKAEPGPGRVKFATRDRFGTLARDFFARLTNKTLDYYVSRRGSQRPESDVPGFRN